MAVPRPGDAASRASGRAEGMDSPRCAPRAPCLRGRSSEGEKQVRDMGRPGSGAPTGRNGTAQGNALGTRGAPPPSSPERARWPHPWEAMPPLQGWRPCTCGSQGVALGYPMPALRAEETAPEPNSCPFVFVRGFPLFLFLSVFICGSTLFSSSSLLPLLPSGASAWDAFGVSRGEGRGA